MHKYLLVPFYRLRSDWPSPPEKMKGAVYIHLRKAIRTRGLFLSFTVRAPVYP